MKAKIIKLNTRVDVKHESLKNTVKKVAEYIQHLFDKKESVSDTDNSFLDMKLIKTRKLEKDRNKAELFINSISDFIKKGAKTSKKNQIDMIKSLRSQCGKYKVIITQDIESLKKEYIESKTEIFYRKEKTDDEQKAEDSFNEREEIKETENLKLQIESLENIFQKLWTQNRKMDYIPAFETLNDLYGALNQEFYYTTKGSNKQIPAKIKGIVQNRENNEIIFQLESEDKKDKKDKKTKKTEFATAFKQGNGNSILKDINEHFDIHSRQPDKEESNINWEKVQQDIAQISNRTDAKIINLEPIENFEEKKSVRM